MPTRLVWSPQARIDLLDIYETIGIEQPRAADRYFDKIEAKAEGLVDFPRLGVRCPEIRPAARMLVEAPFVLLYETVPDSDEGPVSAVEVVRVVDGRRDFLNLF